MAKGKVRQKLDGLVEKWSPKVDRFGEKYILPYRQWMARSAGAGILALEGLDSIKNYVHGQPVEAWPIAAAVGAAFIAYASIQGDLNHWHGHVENKKNLTDPSGRRLTGGELLKRAQEEAAQAAQGAPAGSVDQVLLRAALEEAKKGKKSRWQRVKQGFAKFLTDPGELTWKIQYALRVRGMYNETFFPHACEALGISPKAADKKESEAELQTGVYTVRYDDESGTRKEANITLPDLVSKLRDTPKGRLGLRLLRPALDENLSLQYKELEEPPQTAQLAVKTGAGLLLGVGFFYAAKELGMDLNWMSAIIPGACAGWALGNGVQGIGEYALERHSHEKKKAKKPREVQEKERDYASLLEAQIAKALSAQSGMKIDPSLVYVFEAPLDGGTVLYSDLTAADGARDLQWTIREIKPDELDRDYLQGRTPEVYLQDNEARLKKMHHAQGRDERAVAAAVRHRQYKQAVAARFRARAEQ